MKVNNEEKQYLLKKVEKIEDNIIRVFSIYNFDFPVYKLINKKEFIQFDIKIFDEDTLFVISMEYLKDFLNGYYTFKNVSDKSLEGKHFPYSKPPSNKINLSLDIIKNVKKDFRKELLFIFFLSNYSFTKFLRGRIELKRSDKDFFDHLWNLSKGYNKLRKISYDLILKSWVT